MDIGHFTEMDIGSFIAWALSWSLFVLLLVIVFVYPLIGRLMLWKQTKWQFQVWHLLMAMLISSFFLGSYYYFSH